MVSKKMNDNSGASLLLALLFFLLCALAGSVVLAAGTAAAGRMKDVKASEQAYFSVTSAAKLLRDEIDGKSLSYDKAAGEWIQEPDSKLKELLEEKVKESIAAQDGMGEVQKEDLTIKPSDIANKESLGTVKAAFYMEKSDYSIVITLSLETAEDDDPGYTCTLTIPAAIMGNGEAEGGNSDILSLVWSNASITRGG